MKMSDLINSNNESYRLREALKEQLTEFRLRFDDYDFTISYDFNGGIKVLTSSLKEWNQGLNKILCEEFGVKLVDMLRTESYAHRVHDTKLMFHYLPVDSLEDELEWSDFIW